MSPWGLAGHTSKHHNWPDGYLLPLLYCSSGNVNIQLTCLLPKDGVYNRQAGKLCYLGGSAPCVTYPYLFTSSFCEVSWTLLVIWRNVCSPCMTTADLAWNIKQWTSHPLELAVGEQKMDPEAFWLLSEQHLNCQIFHSGVYHLWAHHFIHVVVISGDHDLRSQWCQKGPSEICIYCP